MKKINEKLIVLLILGLLVHQHQVNCFFTMALSLIQFAWSSFEVADSVHDTYTKIDTPSTTDLMEKSEELADSLDNWGGRIEEKIQKSVDMLLTRLPLAGQINDDVQELNGFIGRIEELYFDFRFYLEDPDAFDQKELEALIGTFTSRKHRDVQGTISAMFNLIVPQRLGTLKKSLFLLLAEESQEKSLDLCNTGGSPQQRLIQFYDVIIETEMRAYMMNLFGYEMEGFIHDTNRSSVLKLIRTKLIMRAKEYLKLLKSTMGQASTVFRQCDPTGGHERGVTYHEFEKFMTGFVVAQEVFRKDHTCPGKCEQYSSPTEQHHQGCEGAMCQWNDQACSGKLAECSTMMGRTSFCLNNGTEARRFQWFEDEEKTYGDDANGCSGELRWAQKYLTKERKWCDICRCICLEEGSGSEHKNYISLNDHMTDVNDNMVAVGVKFVVHEKTLYVQLMQGKLGPLAEIPENSTSWVDIAHDEHNAEVDLWRQVEGFEDIGFNNYVFTLTPEEKSINLDFLTTPRDHVITGARFQKYSSGRTTQVQLEIHASSFDAKTGKLNRNSGRWIKPQDMPYARKKESKRIEYEQAEGKRNPAESWSTKIDTAPYTFIDLDHTSMEHDAAQTVIPLMDAIPVVTQPPIPIVGLGLYHKKQPGYGGFLTFVLKGINMAAYIQTDV